MGPGPEPDTVPNDQDQSGPGHDGERFRAVACATSLQAEAGDKLGDVPWTCSPSQRMSGVQRSWADIRAMPTKRPETTEYHIASGIRPGEAEGEGFEPSRSLTTPNGFRDT
jgi:hypothetical protein